MRQREFATAAPRIGDRCRQFPAAILFPLAEPGQAMTYMLTLPVCSILANPACQLTTQSQNHRPTFEQ
jgi:hypothetical protein